MEEQWLTVKDLAEYLKVSTDLIYRLAQRGIIPASKVANRWRFRKDKVDLWMDRQGNYETRIKMGANE
jgi:excisionase family DNA binding protein